ncbi:MAG: uracil-DNA glycosylase [Rhodobacteraceae bacterium]|nr:MAG: uracil-DNA glycosylase [Paracoccaceae bacterium]
MESALDYHSALALLQWQVELGVTESIGDVPVDRYALQATPPKAKTGPAPVIVKPKDVDPVEQAQQAARAATGLPSLRAALQGFDHCELKKGARNLVFCDGQAGARVMIIGEAPGRDEDREGKPFVGNSGQLLDKMLAAIGLSRDKNVYITNVLPWRPPQNRDPLPLEIAMMQPFLQRHVELAEPDVLVLMGNVPCQAVLGKRGITRLRGDWQQAWGKPVIPMFHPAYLLRQPNQKRAAWADLLALKARLAELS